MKKIVSIGMLAIVFFMMASSVSALPHLKKGSSTVLCYSTSVEYKRGGTIGPVGTLSCSDHPSCKITVVATYHIKMCVTCKYVYAGDFPANCFEDHWAPGVPSKPNCSYNPHL